MRQPLSYAKPVSRCASHVVGHTLFSALSNATYPERLYFGIVQQASAVARAQRRTTAAPTLPAALHQRAPDLQPGSRRCPVSPSSPRRAPLAGVSRGPARAHATLPHAQPEAQESTGMHALRRSHAPMQSCPQTCTHSAASRLMCNLRKMRADKDTVRVSAGGCVSVRGCRLACVVRHAHMSPCNRRTRSVPRTRTVSRPSASKCQTVRGTASRRGPSHTLHSTWQLSHMLQAT